MILPKAEIRTRSRMRCRFCRVNFTIASRNINDIIYATLNLRQKPMDEVNGSRRGGGPEWKKTPGDAKHGCP